MEMAPLRESDVVLNDAHDTVRGSLEGEARRDPRAPPQANHPTKELASNVASRAFRHVEAGRPIIAPRAGPDAPHAQEYTHARQLELAGFMKHLSEGIAVKRHLPSGKSVKVRSYFSRIARFFPRPHPPPLGLPSRRRARC